jgi:prepilin-type processing-associated H-X9-DG protein
VAAVFNCPACHQTISAEVPAGMQVQCPYCRAVVAVPGSVADGAAPAAVTYASGMDMPGRQSVGVGALVCGIIGLVFTIVGSPLSIIALILGIRGINASSRNPQRYAGRGLAVAGVVLGAAGLLVDLCAVVILFPALSRVRELSQRTVCSANLRGLGQALYIYAQDEPFAFPAVFKTSELTSGNMYLFNPQHRTTPPSPKGIPSPTVDLWVLVRANNTMPRQFVCPSTTDLPDPATNAASYYDFASPVNLSYGYQYQHDPNRRPIGTSSEPTFPLMADANPYIKGGVPGTTFAQDRTSPYRGNSANHSNREGQNVLYQDGHVSWEKGPDCGLSGRVGGGLTTLSRSRDNIYTTNSAGPGAIVDPGSAAPAWTNPQSAGTCDLGGKSDACLVP